VEKQYGMKLATINRWEKKKKKKEKKERKIDAVYTSNG
jgi:hypothetical protein